MTQPSQVPLADYSFHRQVHNLVYDQLGQTVLRIPNEQFKGTAIADTTEYQYGQPIAHSNVPRALSYNQILHKLTKGRIHIASPTDVVQFWDDIPERDTTYADTNSIVIFPHQGSNQDLAQKVLSMFDLQSTSMPLLFTNLEPVRAANEHGFTLERTASTQVTEAPYLAQDGRVRYDPETQDLVAAKDDEEGVQIYVPKDQSGLRWAYRNRGYGLSCGNERLLDSDADGRVQVVQADPKDRAA